MQRAASCIHWLFPDCTCFPSHKCYTVRSCQPPLFQCKPLAVLTTFVCCTSAPFQPPLHLPPTPGGAANLSLVNTTYSCVAKQAVLPSGDSAPDPAGIEGTAIDGAAAAPPSTAASSSGDTECLYVVVAHIRTHNAADVAMRLPPFKYWRRQVPPTTMGASWYVFVSSRVYGMFAISLPRVSGTRESMCMCSGATWLATGPRQRLSTCICLHWCSPH